MSRALAVFCCSMLDQLDHLDDLACSMTRACSITWSAPALVV
ncbi:hypothetical protein [Streptomyces sp. NPDC047972]